MKGLIFGCVLLLFGQQETSSFDAPVENITIYYDMNWKAVPMIKDGDNLKEHVFRYGWLPCSCQDYTCGCCMNMNINFANFSRSGCMNMTYLPKDFAIEMNMLWNDESFYKRNVSAKNPPPVCMSVPLQYLPTMQFCVKLFDIYTPGRNLHVCMDFETRIENAPILILQFDCVVMGSDGLSHIKPGESSETVVEGSGSGNTNSSIKTVPLPIPLAVLEETNAAVENASMANFSGNNDQLSKKGVLNNLSSEKIDNKDLKQNINASTGYDNQNLKINITFSAETLPSEQSL